MPEKGEVLNGRYRVETLLGQGGFGAVYRAWDEVLKGPCALKESFGSTPELDKQFAREASMLFNLKHPGLPRVFDYFSIPGEADYLVMDYVEGDDLQTLMRRRQSTLLEAEVVAWATQVCDALMYLHKQTPPVIHRDIKPANIKITPEGDAVLVDFGASKMVDPSVETTLGARAVTSGYSPPEQYGLGRTDVRADIYALGATLYHLLTGLKPPDSLEMLTENQPTPPLPSAVNASLSESIDSALTRAMQLDRIQRFQGIDEFRAALSISAEAPLVVNAAPSMPLLSPAEVTQSPSAQPAPANAKPAAATVLPAAATDLPAAESSQPLTSQRSLSTINLKSSPFIRVLPWIAGLIILGLVLVFAWPDQEPTPLEATQTVLAIQQTQAGLTAEVGATLPPLTQTSQPDGAAAPPEATQTPEGEIPGATETASEVSPPPTDTQPPTSTAVETETPTPTETPPPAVTEILDPTHTWTAPPSLTPALAPSATAIAQTWPISETGDEACHLIPEMQVSSSADANLRSRPGILGSNLLDLDLSIPLTVVEDPVWDRTRLDLNTYGWWWHVQGPTAILDGWLWEGHIEECLP